MEEWIQNSFESIQIIPKFGKLYMDIQQPMTNSVFQPIHKLQAFKQRSQCPSFENQFALQFGGEERSLLTMIGNILLLSDLTLPVVEPYAWAELNFDLKFEIIYEQEKNINSKKLGLKLFIDGNRTISFFSTNRTKLELWSSVLAKHINQKGFHQMFRPLKKLGKGNFASVYEVERLTDNRRFAVKAFSKQNSFAAKNGRESLINQLAIMRELSAQPHQNVLALEGVFESDNSIYVVLELLTGCQFFHKIQQTNGYFSKLEIQQVMAGLLGGLKHLHSHRIMHRDIKPQNIMLRSKDSMSPVIVDFGLATPVDAQRYLFFRCGTPGYVAPEIIELTESKHIEPECDVFSVGVIFHIMLTRKALFEGTKYDQVYKKNKEMAFNLDAESYKRLEPSAQDLLKKMLIANPKERITAEEALKHEYFVSQAEKEKIFVQKISSPVLTTTGSEKKKSKKTFFLF